MDIVINKAFDWYSQLLKVNFLLGWEVIGTIGVDVSGTNGDDVTELRSGSKSGYGILVQEEFELSRSSKFIKGTLESEELSWSKSTKGSRS